MHEDRRRFLERAAGIVAGGSLVGLAGCNSLGGFMGGGGANQISYGGSVQGELQQSDQEGYRGYEDRIAFQGSTGDIVTITMESEPGDTFLILEDPNGNRVTSNDDADFDLNSQISSYTLRSDGQYTIVATSFVDTATFPYTVSLQKVGEVDSGGGGGGGGGGNGGTSPTLISYGQTVSGEITTSDASGIRGYYDVYEFQGSAGDFVRIEMSSGVGDTYLMLQDPDGLTVTEDDDGGSGLNSMIENVELSSSGRYRIIATSFSDSDTFSYTLGLDEYQPASDGNQPSSISYGQTVGGELSVSDQQGFRGYYDAYEFQGSAGDFVTIDMTSPSGDTYLMLRGPSGEIVTEDDDGGAGLESSIEGYELQSSGTYQVIATSYTDSATFSYQVSLSA